MDLLTSNKVILDKLISDKLISNELISDPLQNLSSVDLSWILKSNGLEVETW